jgi:dipeptidyl aminopeptidase/acylaminoacyl peptidase
MKRVLFFSVLLFVSQLAAQQPKYTIEQYLSIKSASAPSFSPDGKRIAYLTNVTGTTQVWTIAIGSNDPHRVTNFEDNVSFVRWLDAGILFGKAKGGDENTQFYLIQPDGTGLRALTDDPNIRNNFGVVFGDGKQIAYASNKRNRQFFDIYTRELATGKEQLVYQYDGNADIAAVNEAGTKFIVSREGTDFSLDNNLYLIEPAGKNEYLLTPHTDASEFGNANFTADGIVFTHNDGREFAGLAQLRKKNAATDDWTAPNRTVSILEDQKWDVTNVAMDPYGGKMAYAVNKDGFSELYIRGYETDGKPLITVMEKKSEPVKLPGQGIVSGLRFNSDETKLAFSLSSAISPSEIWVYDLATKQLKQITHSDTANVAPITFIAPALITYKTFDGRSVSAWYYQPQSTRTFTLDMNAPNGKGLRVNRDPMPVIVSVHGGPEGQERPSFSGLYQYYLSRGYAILAPNVRGSTGYGKTYTHLDDVRKREDSVRDLAYAVDWLKKSGNADPKRIAVMGGSYGGYMTLAAITLYPEIWSAAVCTVGISNWESFLKNTSGYRRRQREVEYGRLDQDIDFLRAISPVAKVDRIKAPLFVIAGRNDPRVPYTEAEQIVAAIKKRGGVVEYKLYDDEGHGISKLKNRIELYPLVADFLDRNMRSK